MGLFVFPTNDSPQEHLRAAKGNLGLYIDHRRNEVDESMLYLLRLTMNQIEDAEKGISE